MELKVTHWNQEDPPTVEAITELLAEEDLRVFHWSEPPDTSIAGHTHGYHKLLYVLEGSIKFDFPTRHETITLSAGDKLELPSGIRHHADVGVDGVKCLEAHIY